jgi:hypothetical protein
MSEEQNKPPADPSQVFDLSFVPAWARQPPAADPYAGGTFEEPRSRERRDDRRGARSRSEGGRERGGGGRGDRRDRSRRDPAQGVREGGSVPRPDRRAGGPSRARSAAPPPEPPLPLQIAFLPDQDRLAAMIADIRAAGHAFPLPELAHLFLTRPEWHLVKFESNKRAGGAYVMELFVSKLNGQVYLSRDEALRDVARQAMETYFVAESVQKDPPAGNYVCVARCRLSGTLLGPPNFHGYNEQLDELRRTRFPRMTLDEYRREIETVRDPELIEKWKEEWRTQTVYRRKPETEDGEPGEPLDAAQVRTLIEQELAPAQVAMVRRAIVPGPLSREIRNPRLIRQLRVAWSREQRFPGTLVRALRGACKRMGLHLFQASDSAAFVTGIEPKPIDPARVIAVIREVLEWLEAHPGCTRTELIEGVRPGTGEDPTKLGEVLQPLTWLLEKGHVIEFHNGTLAVPKAVATKAGAKEEKPEDS